METDLRRRIAHPAVTMSIELRGLREDVYRIAAAADCVVEEQNLLVGIGSTRSMWDRAGIILIDFVSAEAALATGFPRRSGVILVTDAPPTLDD